MADVDDVNKSSYAKSERTVEEILYRLRKSNGKDISSNLLMAAPVLSDINGGHIQRLIIPFLNKLERVEKEIAEGTKNGQYVGSYGLVKLRACISDVLDKIADHKYFKITKRRIGMLLGKIRDTEFDSVRMLAVELIRYDKSNLGQILDTLLDVGMKNTNKDVAKSIAFVLGSVYGCALPHDEKFIGKILTTIKNETEKKDAISPELVSELVDLIDYIYETYKLGKLNQQVVDVVSDALLPTLTAADSVEYPGSIYGVFNSFMENAYESGFNVRHLSNSYDDGGLLSDTVRPPGRKKEKGSKSSARKKNKQKH